ncbi:MAG: hypothetical protein ABSC48_06585 [Terracidiphilus sp.]
MFAALRFIWNATRGHRLRPWRSEFLRWRVETYSGKRAETLTAIDILSGQWSVVSGQWSVVSGQWSVVSGQWSVVSGQWSVVSGQWSNENMQVVAPRQGFSSLSFAPSAELTLTAKTNHCSLSTVSECFPA